MGREIKRVQKNFNWPLNQPWKGFISPYNSQKCRPCNQTGLNPETRKIHDSWYSSNDRSKAWNHNITQDEVNHLAEEGRLYDFTHNFIIGKGWVEKNPKVIPTAKQVNLWSRKGFGHDGTNQWICVQYRAKKMGVYGLCKWCKGEAEFWYNDEIKKLSENFEGYEPPKGKAYQLWETVSEGSPISPTFEKPENLAKWLSEEKEYGGSFTNNGESYETWMKFILGPGWAMSGAIQNGKMMSGVEAVTQNLK